MQSTCVSPIHACPVRLARIAAPLRHARVYPALARSILPARILACESYFSPYLFLLPFLSLTLRLPPSPYLRFAIGYFSPTLDPSISTLLPRTT